MISKKLKEAVKLLGGKAVIADMDEVYILTTLKEFRKMRENQVGGLTKQELVDKINNDIAIWKSSQESTQEDAINFQELEENTSEEVRYVK
jgi:hypothetical protein